MAVCHYVDSPWPVYPAPAPATDPRAYAYAHWVVNTQCVGVSLAPMDNKVKLNITVRPATRAMLAAMAAAGKGESISDMVDQLATCGADVLLKAVSA